LTSRTLPAEHPTLSSANRNRLQPNVFATPCIVGEHPARLCGLRSNFTFPSSCGLALRPSRPFPAGVRPFGFPTLIDSVRRGRSRRLPRPDADSTYTISRRFARTTIKFQNSGIAADRLGKRPTFLPDPGHTLHVRRSHSARRALHRRRAEDSRSGCRRARPVFRNLPLIRGFNPARQASYAIRSS
jgi:hypothetical protein